MEKLVFSVKFLVHSLFLNEKAFLGRKFIKSPHFSLKIGNFPAITVRGSKSLTP